MLSNKSVALTFQDLLTIPEDNNGRVVVGDGKVLPVLIDDSNIILYTLTKVDGNVFVTGAFSLEGSFDVSNSVSVKETLTVSGATSVYDTVTIYAPISVSGDAVFLKDVDVSGDIHSSNLSTGDIEGSGSVHTIGDIFTEGKLTVYGQVSISDIMNMNLSRIYNLGDPISAYDATNKRYVDELHDTALSYAAFKAESAMDYADEQDILVKEYSVQQDELVKLYSEGLVDNVSQIITRRFYEIDQLLTYIANEVAASGLPGCPDCPGGVWYPSTYSGAGVITVVEILPSDENPLPDTLSGNSGSSLLYSRADHSHEVSDIYALSDHIHIAYETSISGIEEDIDTLSGFYTEIASGIVALSGMFEAETDLLESYVDTTVSGLNVFVSSSLEDSRQLVLSGVAEIGSGISALELYVDEEISSISGYVDTAFANSVQSFEDYADATTTNMESYVDTSISGVQLVISGVVEDFEDDILALDATYSGVTAGLASDISTLESEFTALVSGHKDEVDISLSNFEDYLDTTTSGFYTTISGIEQNYIDYMDTRFDIIDTNVTDLETYTEVAVSGLYTYIDDENDAQDLLIDINASGIAQNAEDILTISGYFEVDKASRNQDNTLSGVNTFIQGTVLGDNTHVKQTLISFDKGQDTDAELIYDIDFFGEPDFDFVRLVAGKWGGIQEGVCFEVESEDGRRAVLLARTKGMVDGVAEVGVMQNELDNDMTGSRSLMLRTIANTWEIYQMVGDTERLILEGTYDDSRMKISSVKNQVDGLLKVGSDGFITVAVPGVDYVPPDMLATQSGVGLMSPEDKRKLDLIDDTWGR